MQVEKISYRSIWLADDGWRVEIIDQTRLPHEFKVVTLETLDDAAHAIREMLVRIACQTYHKYPGEGWADFEFREYEVKLVSGHVVSMRLAERGVLLGGKIWVREIRRLTKSSHQTAIISTDYQRDLTAAGFLSSARVMLSRGLKRYYEPLRLPIQPRELSASLISTS